MSHINKFGRNPDISTGADEDIWDGGGIWVPPTAARVHNIVSGSADDDAVGGDGARTLRVYGLDEDYFPQNELVELDGLVPVATLLSYVMVHRMVVETAGVDGANEGNITATAAGDGTVTAQVSAGFNQTLMAIYQVPAGKTAYLHAMHGSVVGNTSADGAFTLLETPFGQAIQTKFIFGLHATGTSMQEVRPGIPFVHQARSIIRMRGSAGANNMVMTAGFDIGLEAAA